MKNKLWIIIPIIHALTIILILKINKGFGGGHAFFDQIIYWHSMPWGLFTWHIFNNWIIGGIVIPFLLHWLTIIIIMALISMATKK